MKKTANIVCLTMLGKFLSIASACGAFGQFYTSLAGYSKRGIPRHTPLRLAHKQEDQVMIAAQFFTSVGKRVTVV